MATTTEPERKYEREVLLLRVQLYSAAQLFKGQDLADLRELVTELAQTLEFERG